MTLEEFIKIIEDGDEDELEFETRDLKPFIGKKILNILGLEVGKSRLVINFTDGSWLGFSTGKHAVNGSN